MLAWDEFEEPNTRPLAHYQIIRRNGAVVPFEPSEIAIPMMKACMAVRGICAFIGGPTFLGGSLPGAFKLQPSVQWLLFCQQSQPA